MHGNDLSRTLWVLGTACLVACSGAPAEAPAQAPVKVADEPQAPAPAAAPQPSAAPELAAKAPDAPSAVAPQPSAAGAKPVEHVNAAVQADAKPASIAAPNPAAAPAAPAIAAGDVAKPAAAAPAPAAAPTPCGDEGMRPCPLQGFMQDHLDAYMDSGDLAKIGAGLTRAATLAPDPAWNAGADGWSQIANTGATAAKNGDFDGAKQSCKTCHRTWRKKYKDQFRLRPLP